MQSDCSEQSLIEFVKSMGFSDFSEKLVETAFTHSSFTKEHDLSHVECYERLEFLGDALLKMVVTDYLYKKFPKSTEGELTKIRAIVVSDEILYQAAQKLNIEPYIKVGAAEEKCGSKKLKSIQACVMEALFGALYLSADRQVLYDFVLSCVIDFIVDIAQNNTVYNAKAVLQEYFQKNYKMLPVYNLVDVTGAAHDKTFAVNVMFKDEELAAAQGKTKKAAEQEAAFIACRNLGLIKEKEEN